MAVRRNALLCIKDPAWNRNWDADGCTADSSISSGDHLNGRSDDPTRVKVWNRKQPFGACRFVRSDRFDHLYICKVYNSEWEKHLCFFRQHEWRGSCVYGDWTDYGDNGDILYHKRWNYEKEGVLKQYENRNDQWTEP